MSGKVSEIRSTPSPKAQRLLRKISGDPEEDGQFKRMLKEVRDFVMPKLGQQEARQWEEERIKALGGTIEKRQKQSYKQMQMKQKELEQQRQETLKEEKLLGVTMSSSQHRTVHMVDRLRKQRKEAIKQKKRRREDAMQLQLGMKARERRGLVTIPSRSIQQFKRKAGART